ncbi:MAG: ArsR/SmtB family transcription factor [Anaerolineae bacterium]
MLEQHAATMLGAARSDGTAPVLDWLPAQNPLRVHARLEEAVRGGRLRVCFWAEPFGMADLSSLHPGCVLVAFAHPGPLYQNFLDFAGDLAGRAKAVADPTRLIILRLIRHFGMTNTEIANFMEIARPTASVHAKILREAGLIRSHQDGREVRHQIVPAGVRQLFADLERFLDLPEA